jgi:hypothetical protein
VLREQPVGIGVRTLAAAGVALVALMLVPLPRSTVPVRAVVETHPSGEPTMQADNDGLPAVRQDVTVDVRVDPPAAADGADWFEVVSWQGGGSKLTPLREVGPGLFRSAGAVPTGSGWKSVVRLTRGPVMMGVPIYMPADAIRGAPEIPVSAQRSATFQADSSLLMREAHGGPAWPALIAYAAIAAVATTWVAVMLVALRGLAGKVGSESLPSARARARLRGLRPARQG